MSTGLRSVGSMLNMQHKPCEGDGCDEIVEYIQLTINGKTYTPKYCHSCQLKYDPVIPVTKAQVDREKHLLESWKKICPAKYQTIEEGGETDVSKLPEKQLLKVLDWSPELRPRGLVLHGETGKCKTRCMWRLLRKLHDAGMKIIAFDCVSFQHECSQHFRDGTEARWLRNILTADILFFDDLWKMSMTDRVDAELFGIIERRGAECKPYFCTTNFTGESLVAESRKPNSRISYDRAVAIYRRLREDCTAISFK